jgi:hypothetical protein
MDAAAGRRTERRLAQTRHALAGLQAGMTGAFAMILWSALASAWNRRSFWIIPNLYATAFYGSRVYVNQFMRGSWSGLATMVVICGVAGMFWGLIWRDQARPFMGLMGAVCGLMFYYFLFDFVLRYASPLIPLYAPERQMQIGYVLWGIAVARSPFYSRRIAQAFQGQTAGDGQIATGAEIRSGEVIL